MTTYREGSVGYRDATVPYRGKPEPVPGIDLNRTDGISIYIQDKTGKRYGQLPAASIKKAKWTLDDLMQAELDFNHMDPTIAKALLLQRDVLIVWNNVINQDTGKPECIGGTLGRESGEHGSKRFVVDDFGMWLKQRCVEVGSLQYDNMDQFDIAWNLISVAQTGTNYDLAIHAGYAPSGVNRYRIYERTRHQYILDLLKQFNTVDRGFDWEFRYDPITGQRQWVPYYPKRGTLKTKAHLVWGRNIVKYSYDRNGWATKTKMVQKGASYAGINFEQIYEDVAASTKYGAMVGVKTDSGQKDVGWLLDEATKAINVLRIPPTTLTVTVRDLPGDPNYNIPAVPIFGVVHPGDTVQVDIDDHGNQVHGQFRVETFTWEGPNKYTLTFLNPSADTMGSL